MDSLSLSKLGVASGAKLRSVNEIPVKKVTKPSYLAVEPCVDTIALAKAFMLLPKH